MYVPYSKEKYEKSSQELDNLRTQNTFEMFQSILEPETSEPRPIAPTFGTKVAKAKAPLTEGITWRNSTVNGTPTQGLGTIALIAGKASTYLLATTKNLPATSGTQTIVVQERFRKTTGSVALIENADGSTGGIALFPERTGIILGTIELVAYNINLSAHARNLTVSTTSKNPGILRFYWIVASAAVLEQSIGFPAGTNQVQLFVTPPANCTGFGFITDSVLPIDLSSQLGLNLADTYLDSEYTLKVTPNPTLYLQDDVDASTIYSQSLYLTSTASALNNGGDLACVVLPPHVKPGDIPPGLAGMTSRANNKHIGIFAEGARVSIVPNLATGFFYEDGNPPYTETGYIRGYIDYAGIVTPNPPPSGILRVDCNSLFLSTNPKYSYFDSPGNADFLLAMHLVMSVVRATGNKNHMKYFNAVKDKVLSILRSPTTSTLLSMASPRIGKILDALVPLLPEGSK